MSLAVLSAAALSGCGGEDDGDRAAAAPAGLRVTGASLDVPLNPTVGAVRMVIHNPTAADDHLVGVSSPDAEQAMVHRSVLDAAGRSSMEDAGEPVVPAGGQLAFGPGDLHVMLTGISRELNVGDTVRLDLRFRRAGALAVEVAVIEPGDAP